MARPTSTAIKYRMGAGFAGDVNRTHPASIEPCFPDATNPPTAYGQAVVVDSTSANVRKLISTASDNGFDTIYGITVRPYPASQLTATTSGAPADLGDATPPTDRVIDVLRAGYIMVKLPTGITGAKKGGRVYMWAVASTGSHVLGGFEVSACSGKAFLIDEKTYYNGVEDSSGVVEIAFNV